MSDYSIYRDIAERTGGDIYIGVVGPVRSGKSTFIKRCMEAVVLPNIGEGYSRDRARDELPQSAAGKTVMTTEPKFIPEEAVPVVLDQNAQMRVRMIDCVGYLIPEAMGTMEEGQPRMVRTPWQEEPMPFAQAAETGTRKVIAEHSTIGMLVTSDGTVGEIPREAYYGVQSLRGAQNFPIIDQKLNPFFIKNMARIKKAAAIVNHKPGALSLQKRDAIVQACDEVIQGRFDAEFITDAIQGGAGTSANMNANEVIANRAIELLGGDKGDYSIVHPNDDVNMAQSTNDVIPTAGKMTVVDLIAPLLGKMAKLRDAFAENAKEFDGIIKMGRTQMQDAVPIRLGQEFAAYATVTARDIKRIAAAEEKVSEYENLFSSPDFFAQHGNDSAKLQQEFENAQKELASLYSRWEELEAKAAECQK